MSGEVILVEERGQIDLPAIAQQIGYSVQNLDPDLIQRDIAANLKRSVEACLEVGRALYVLKEICPHGQFLARLEVLGLERTLAFRFIQTAIKFAKLSNVASTQHLMEALGNQTKLLEMLVLDDEKLEELAITGQSGELVLDDIAAMSVKELRHALRAAKTKENATTKSLQEKIEAQDRLLIAKNHKIDELDTELDLQKNAANRANGALTHHLTENEEDPAIKNGNNLRQSAGIIAFEAEAILRGKLVNVFRELDEHGNTNDIFHADFMTGLICQLEATIKQIRANFVLKDVPNGEIIPAWAQKGALENLPTLDDFAALQAVEE